MDERWEKVAAIDLSSVRAKFLARKGVFWRLRKSARRVEDEYRQFLFLVATNPGQTVVPWSQDLDDFWHEHILNTAKYAGDCESIMGAFIHHNPHLPEGSPAHGKAFAETRLLYKAAFKDAIRDRRRGIATAGCSSNMPLAFCDSSSAHSHHGAGHDAGGHHGGHGCAGHGGGHGCGGHGGH
jgi:hypothetical protein